MKLNFWQWLGLIFFVVALGLIIWQKSTNSLPPLSPPPVDESTAPETPATETSPTEPATGPTTAP